MVDITYGCSSHPYAAPNDRPWLDVTFRYGPNTQWLLCLVDTGADDTTLDLGTAVALGIPTLALRSESVTVGNGMVSKYKRAPAVQMTFEGASVVADVLFGPVSVPIIGRSALLRATGFDVGFGQTGWLHT